MGSILDVPLELVTEAAGTTVSPSAVDQRNLLAPARALRIAPSVAVGIDPASGALSLDRDLRLGGRVNLWGYTEDLGQARYSAGAATKQTDQLTIAGMTLTRFTGSSFYSLIYTSMSGYGAAPYVAGRRYLTSFFVVNASDTDRFIWMRPLANGSSFGHGARLLPPNALTRIWSISEATSTTQVAPFANPAGGYGDGAPNHPHWLQLGNGGANLNLYIGGFQIEDIGTTAKDGIAVIGDSTFQGSSGGYDAMNAREVPQYLAGLLNCNTYNRAVGGQRLDQMDSRWAADITPLAAVSKYALIQGGINDIGQSRTLGQMQANVASMTAKALADGLVPVHVTVTPFAAAAADATKEALRQSYNAWLKQTYPNVIDIAAVVTDPYRSAELRRTSGTSWAGDGTHYSTGAKRAIAEVVAGWPGWEFPTPAPYQKIAASTWSSPGGDIYRNGNKVVGERDAGWTVGTGTPNKGAFAADTATAAQAA